MAAETLYNTYFIFPNEEVDYIIDSYNHFILDSDYE